MIARLLDRYFIKKPLLRRFVTRMLWGDRDAPLPILGAVVHANTLRENGYHRAVRRAVSSSLWRDEAAVLLNLSMLLRDGDTFVDAGANVGLFSAVLSRCVRLGIDVRFYAFEPHPDTYRRLERTARAAGVSTYPIALSDHRGAMRFIDGAVSHVFTTVDHANAYSIAGTETTVECERLDAMSIEGDSIVLKIDVEGQERAVLEGAEALFAAGRIKAVYVDGYSDRAIPDWLRARRFELFDGRTLGEPQGFSLLAVRYR